MMAIEAKGLAKSFGKGRVKTRAVRDVNFQAARGTVVLVTGPSGSGKTTFLSLLSGLMRPDAGRIRMRRTPITGQSSTDLAAIRRRRVGFVFQNFQLLGNLTASENVEVALNLVGTRGPKARQQATRLLDQVGLRDRAHLLPDALSGGEKQRVAFARAIANTPELLFADEPTANLDAASGRRIMEVLADFARRGGTVVVVSHDERVRGFADTVYAMEDGFLHRVARM